MGGAKERNLQNNITNKIELMKNIFKACLNWLRKRKNSYMNFRKYECETPYKEIKLPNAPSRK